jgi:exopolysaccharide transport family protein
MASSTPIGTEGGALVSTERHELRGRRRPDPNTSLLHVANLNDIDLRSLGRTIWRWRAIVVWSTLILTAVSVAIIYRLTPLYTASTQVLVGIDQVKIGKLEDLVSGLKEGNETIATEIGVIRSRNLAEKIINQLNLDKNPEFNAALRPQSAWQKFLADQTFIPHAWVTALLNKHPAASSDRRDMSKIIDVFLDKLKVTNDGHSRIINIAFESPNPKTAAQVVNALADAYIVARLDAKFEATRRANMWLADRLNSLRQEVLASEDAVERFRAQNGLMRSTTSTLTTQEVAQVAAEVIAARTKRLDAQSRLAQIERAGAGRNGKVDHNIMEVLQSPTIQQLSQQEGDASRRAADLMAQYGDRHPKVISVKAEIADIKAKIQKEVGKIIDALHNEVATQQARENSLTTMLNKLKAQANRASMADVQLRDLERQAEANRTLYENFLNQFKMTQSQDTFQQPDANIISRADVPEVPSFPQKPALILLSALASFTFGVFLALLCQYLDVGVRSMEQIQNLLKVYPLGMVPAPNGLGKTGGKLAKEVIDRPLSTYSESIRTIHTNLMLSDVDTRPRVVLVTSSLPGEGKSTVAISLAQMAARYGQKVVLIDGDLRRPAIHRLAKVSTKPGLVDWLLNRCSFEEIVHRHASGGVDIIPSGELPTIPPNLLSSERFKQLLRGLVEQYDLVILDSAPVLALPDTRVLSVLADKTIFVVRWAATSYRVASTALRQLQDGGAYVAGAVLTAVDVKAHAKDGFADSVLYAGRLKEYYR